MPSVTEWPDFLKKEGFLSAMPERSITWRIAVGPQQGRDIFAFKSLLLSHDSRCLLTRTVSAAIALAAQNEWRRKRVFCFGTSL